MSGRRYLFFLRHGVFIGKAKQDTTVENEEAPEGEEVFWKEAVVPTGRPVEEPDLEESCDDAHVQVVLDNFPPELDLDQRTAAQ